MRFLSLLLSIFVCTTVFAQKKYSADDAGKHIGDSATVCGKVYGGKFLETSKGTPTLINMGAAFPKSPFTFVIFADARKLFKDAPEVFYNNKNVCVNGVIKEYKNKPQIIVEKPGQIVVE